MLEYKDHFNVSILIFMQTDKCLFFVIKSIFLSLLFVKIPSNMTHTKHHKCPRAEHVVVFFLTFLQKKCRTPFPTWITRMFSPVSWASCSRMCRVGFGVATNAALNVSSCLALMVVRGPRLLVPEFCSSFSILFVSLSEDVELSVSFMSSCVGSCRSGDKLLSVHDDTDGGRGRRG